LELFEIYFFIAACARLARGAPAAAAPGNAQAGRADTDDRVAGGKPGIEEGARPEGGAGRSGAGDLEHRGRDIEAEGPVAGGQEPLGEDARSAADVNQEAAREAVPPEEPQELGCRTPGEVAEARVVDVGEIV